MIGPCKEMLEHLAAYVDNQIEDEARATVQAHVEHCLACQEEIEAQKALKRQIKVLKRRETRAYPNPNIWANAVREWDHRDDVRRRRYQMRFAMMAACMLLFLFGAVWARLVAGHDFPVDAVMRDFQHARTAHVTPMYPTVDSDAAARYIKKELGVDLPPLNLVLSRSQLLGVDMIPTAHTKCARLLYRTPQGLVGIYIAPGSTQFTELKSRSIEGESFYIDNPGDNKNDKKIDGRNKDVGLYGWTIGRVGYGLVAATPLDAVRNVVLDAERSTEQPGQ
jgi:anti-sigma factor RsiW